MWGKELTGLELNNISFESHDLLNRSHIGDDIIKYVETLQHLNPCTAISVGLNAKWGEGKTFFISMWKKRIEKDSDRVVYYNAWENDDCDSAILPLLYKIVSLTKNQDDEVFVDHAKVFLKTLAVEATKFGVEKLFGKDMPLSEMIEKGIDSVSSTTLINVFNQFDQYYGNRKLLEDSLAELIPKEGKLWVFIDDLDRCNPAFAINTLECIKHFFNLKNIIYILAVDLEQLSIIASNVYGANIDADSYLKRFFDCIYQMPDADLNTYIERRISQMQVEPETVRWIKYRDIERLFRYFNCSLRDVNLTLTHLEIFLKENKAQIVKRKYPRDTLKIYYYFLIIKDKFNVEYSRIIRGDFLLESATNSHWKIIDPIFVVDDQIKDLFGKISAGQASEYTRDIFKTFDLFDCDEIVTFKEHMERFLK